MLLGIHPLKMKEEHSALLQKYTWPDERLEKSGSDWSAFDLDLFLMLQSLVVRCLATSAWRQLELVPLERFLLFVLQMACSSKDASSVKYLQIELRWDVRWLVRAITWPGMKYFVFGSFIFIWLLHFKAKKSCSSWSTLCIVNFPINYHHDALAHSTAEYCALVWRRSAHTRLIAPPSTTPCELWLDACVLHQRKTFLSSQASNVSSQRSHTIFRTPWLGAWTPAPLTAHPSITVAQLRGGGAVRPWWHFYGGGNMGYVVDQGPPIFLNMRATFRVPINAKGC